MGDTPIVRMCGIIKRFPGVVALNKIDFNLYPGEVHSIVGENGSGKSTLCKCLYGMCRPDEGLIEIDGVACDIRTPNHALQLGITAITQELTLAPTLSVTENILMGRLPVGRFGIDWQRAHLLAREALEQIGAEIDEYQRIGDLSIELQQEVEIARAVSGKSRVLILDEATSSLSEAATDRLMAKIKQLRLKGIAIVFISHRLKETFTCSQRATVLRDGEFVDVVDMNQITESELVSKMVGRTLEDLYNKRQIKISEPLLKVRDLSTADNKVRNINFDLHRGEILGISALAGSGKIQLGKALFGAIPATGEITLAGKSVKMSTPRNGMRSRIGFVPDDRKNCALMMTRNIFQNLSLPWMHRPGFNRFGLVRTNSEKNLARDCIQRFAVRAPSIKSLVVNLSGGNQQKIVLARCFSMNPHLVILAEPTRGIDVGAKSEIYTFIQDLAEQGAGILFISSELPELLGLTDRILVMHQGEICSEFDPGTASEEEITHAACTGKYC